MKRWVIVLCAALCLLLLSGVALAETLFSGNCGTGMTWELRQDDDGLKTLEIKGNGAITSTPWEEIYPCTNVDRLVLNKGITSIPDYAFSILNSGIELTMPSTLRHIGAHAFRGSYPISVTLNEGLESTGEFAFDEYHCCPAVIVPRSLTDIGYQGLPISGTLYVYPGSEAEQWCQDWGLNYRLTNSSGALNSREASLKQLLDAISAADDVPMRYRQPAIDALLEMDSLTSTQLDNLANYVRVDYAALRVAMSDNDLSWQEISNFVLDFVHAMDAIDIDVNWWIYYIGDYPGVRLTVTMNNEQRQYSFYRRQGYWHLSRLPQGTTGYFSWRETGEGLVINGYTGGSSILQIPATLNGKPVVGVENGNWSSTVVNLVLPEGLKFIGQYAFSGLKKLGNLTLPDSLECIYDGAFNGCDLLTSVYLGPNLRILGNAFVNTGVTSIVIPENLVILGRIFDSITISAANTHFTKQDGALYNEDTKTLLYVWEAETNPNFVVKDGTKYIRDDACSGNSNIQTLKLPRSVIEIGHNAFESCKNLTSVVLNEGLEHIGNGAFQFCRKLTSLDLPSTLVEMEYGALKQTGIGQLTIPVKLFTDPSDSWVVADLFGQDLPNLYYIDVADGHPLYTSKEGMLYDKDGHTLLHAPKNMMGTCYLPSDTWVIGRSAFRGTGISGVVMSYGLIEVLGDAFSETEIVSLYFPNSVSVIEWQDSMSALKYITIPGSVTKLGDFTDSGDATTEVRGISGTAAETLATMHGWLFVPLGGTGIEGFQMMVNGKPVNSLTLWQGDVVEVVADAADNPEMVKWDFGDLLVSQVLEVSGNRVRLCGAKPGTNTLTVYAADNPNVKCELPVTVKALSKSTPKIAMLPSSLKTIKNGTFRNTAYQYVYIPDEVKSIGSRAFLNCSNLRVIRVPDSMESIAIDAFKGCENLVLLFGDSKAISSSVLNDPNLIPVSWKTKHTYAGAWWIN